MKALEKAARDRGEARQEAPATAGVAVGANAGPAKPELSLEPLATERPDSPQPAGNAQAASGSAASREQAQAATVLSAGARPQLSGGAPRRSHPLAILGIAALLVAIGFAVYVALQIFQPVSPLGRQAPAVPAGPLPPLTQAPAPPPAAPVTPALPAASVLPPDAAGTATPETAPAPVPVIRPTPRPAPRPAPVAREAATPERDRIVVSRGSPEPTMNPLLPRAYAALQANRLEEARGLYNELLRVEPQSLDALLGLAQIETLEGNHEEATKRYFRILELDPRHALAQSGLIALLGRADPLAAESRLKSLIAREPSAYLHFTLGNLYADQSMWPAAQHAYFQAYHLEPTNPDYAYNLAVGLEHVGQPKAALGFYRRAAELAAARGHTHFNLAQAQERIGKLASQVE